MSDPSEDLEKGITKMSDPSVDLKKGVTGQKEEEEEKSAVQSKHLKTMCVKGLLVRLLLFSTLRSAMCFLPPPLIHLLTVI
jgi:hypothetical protein